jgi:hypothetical protein
MNIAASNEPRIVSFEITEDAIVAHLADGRIVSVPLVWSWRLANATAAQRKRYEIIGSGEGIHWPDIDEDISARGLLHGIPSCPPKQAKTKRRRG